MFKTILKSCREYKLKVLHFNYVTICFLEGTLQG